MIKKVWQNNDWINGQQQSKHCQKNNDQNNKKEQWLKQCYKIINNSLMYFTITKAMQNKMKEKNNK